MDPAGLEIKEDKMSDATTIDDNNEDDVRAVKITEENKSVNWKPKSRY